MSPEQAAQIIRKALWVALKISAPSLLAAMIIGFSVSLFQSITQIQEMTLTFVPKILIFSFIIAVSFPWTVKQLLQFCNELFIYHWDNILRSIG